MVTSVFTCPKTSMKVQHWLSDEDEGVSDNEYEGIMCPACTKMHLINRKSGKLLGQDED